jgi:hypothetical protein
VYVDHSRLPNHAGLANDLDRLVNDYRARFSRRLDGSRDYSGDNSGKGGLSESVGIDEVLKLAKEVKARIAIIMRFILSLVLLFRLLTDGRSGVLTDG